MEDEMRQKGSKRNSYVGIRTVRIELMDRILGYELELSHVACSKRGDVQALDERWSYDILIHPGGI
jgi:hypothetical protein